MKIYDTNPNWKIKCFKCRAPLNTENKCYRNSSGIYCECCGTEIMADEAQAEHEAYFEDKIWNDYKTELESWERNGKKGFKPLNPDEKLLRDSLVRKYGEW
ncbi:MAG: hypothetical protein EAX96_06135 [Candidatus Lokiarchaeota archaeon]|nr:hypothetical protein [Candidatus Lokiarchaeota archaeon]